MTMLQETQSAAEREAATTVIVTDDEMPHDEMPMQSTPWRGVLAIEGEQTGDGRVFAPGGITWRDLPMPLKWQVEDLPGHMESFIVGTIDSLERWGNLIVGNGMIDPEAFDADRAKQLLRLMKTGALRGVSVDPGGVDVMYHEDSDVLEFTAYEIGAATLVAVPAFAGAWIALDGMPDPVDAQQAQDDQVPDGEVVIAHGALTALLASAKPLPGAPPADAFADPQLDRRYGFHVEPRRDGEPGERVWGHVYGWGECHIGSPQGQCVQVPRGSTARGIFAGLDGRGVLCADGTQVSTGPIVIDADHADLRASWLRARDHYAHSGLAVCDVAIGEDEHGIWVAGMVRPGTTPEAIHTLRASAPSVDCRALAGRLELVAILGVNLPGYPAVQAHIDGGQITSLVASGAPAEMACEGSCSCGGTGNQAAPETASVAALSRQVGTLNALLAPALVEALTELDSGMDPALVLDEFDATMAARPRLADLIQRG